MLHTILKFLVSLFSALSRAADASTSDPASTVDTKTFAISTGAGAVPTFVNSKIEKINYLRHLFALGVRHGEESAAKAGSNGDLHPERRASRMQVDLFQK